jgi:hypothetical protein
MKAIKEPGSRCAVEAGSIFRGLGSWDLGVLRGSSNRLESKHRCHERGRLAFRGQAGGISENSLTCTRRGKKGTLYKVSAGPGSRGPASDMLALADDTEERGACDHV